MRYTGLQTACEMQFPAGLIVADGIRNDGMTSTASAFSSEKNSAAAGEDLAAQLAAAISRPDAIVVFLSAQHDYAAVLRVLTGRFSNSQIVGCSSAGEFNSVNQGEGSASAFALSSPEMLFCASLTTSMSRNPEQAARRLLAGFRGFTENKYRHRSALILNDALAGSADELITLLNIETGGKYKFFGGGAGDDAAFTSTHVFFNNQVHTDAAVALEILSTRPIGVGVRHGWSPATEPMRVTSSKGNIVESLDAVAAAEIFAHHAHLTGQPFDLGAPLPFFLHNIAGMRLEEGYKLRVPLAIVNDGAICFAAEIPQGSAISIMSATPESAMKAAHAAAQDAVRQLGSYKPGGALLFDCVATRLRLGKNFGDEVQLVQRIVGDVALAGCNTYGQVATLEGQFAGFHNCTAVVCVFPE